MLTKKLGKVHGTFSHSPLKTWTRGTTLYRQLVVKQKKTLTSCQKIFMESDTNNFKLNLVIYKYKFNETKGFTVKIIGAEPEAEPGDEPEDAEDEPVGVEETEYDPYTMD